MKKAGAGFAWLALSVLGRSAHGQEPGVVLQCRADLAPFGGVTTIRITREDPGRLQAQIEGHVSSPEVVLEAFDSDGRLLGRVLRMMAVRPASARGDFTGAVTTPAR